MCEHGIEYDRLPNHDGLFRVNFMIDGERVHRTLGRASDGITPQRAWDWMAALRVSATEGRLQLPKGRKTEQRFGVVAEDYLEKLEGANGKDIREKRRRLQLHLIPFFGHMPLSRIDALTIERYKKTRSDQPSMRGGVRRGVDGPCCPVARPNKYVTPATINRELAVLSHILSCAVQWGWMRAKLVKIERFPEPETRFEYLTEDDAAHLLTAARNDHHPQIYAFVYIALHTAMRASEVLGLKKSYIDLKKRVIHLPESKTGARDVPISTNLRGFLEEQLQSIAVDDWLFPSSGSKSGHTEDISTPWQRIIMAAELAHRPITRHTLRHTAITHLVQAGVDLPTVQRVSGHKTFEMVRRHAHQNADHVQKALGKLDSRLSSTAARQSASPEVLRDYTGITQERSTSESKKSQVLDGVGRPSRDRTCDQRIKSSKLTVF